MFLNVPLEIGENDTKYKPRWCNGSHECLKSICPKGVRVRLPLSARIIDKISIQNPSSDKKTLVANESILPMSIG